MGVVIPFPNRYAPRLTLVAKQPFLPLFFGDFLASTATWDGEEQALYLLLLGYQWASGPLPEDPQKLARMARYEPKRFQKLWGTVGQKFIAVDSGLLNERLEEHRQKANELAEVASARGRAGARKRWGNTPSMPGAMPQASPEHPPSNSSIPSQSEEKIKNPAARASIPESDEDEDPDDYLIWTAGIELLGESKRSLMGKLVKTHGRDLVARKLGELMAMTEKPRDPAAYFIGVMRKLERRFQA